MTAFEPVSVVPSRIGEVATPKTLGDPSHCPKRRHHCRPSWFLRIDAGNGISRGATSRAHVAITELTPISCQCLVNMGKLVM
jgi:hypothetical protein